MQLDYGFLSEMGTRIAILIVEQAEPFFSDVWTQMSWANADTDYYLVGFRWGQLWKLIFDVKLSA